MKVRKLFTKAYWHRKYVNYLDKTNSEKLIWTKIEELFYANTGKWLDWNHPKDINEKLMWLNRFAPSPLKTKCADKYLVREYLKEKGLDELIVPLLGVWDNPSDIDFDSLPDQFVLKCNHGSGYNIICLDKSTLDVKQTRETLKAWMSEDYSEKLFELHYKTIPRKVIAEPLLSGTAPIEYQFWCLNGEPESILVCRKNFDGTYEAGSFSLQWERLFDRKHEDKTVSFPRPPMGVEVLAEYARRLSAPFPFVRVDFFVVGKKAYLAELTFTPSANLLVKYKQEALDRLGAKLQLPKKV